MKRAARSELARRVDLGSQKARRGASSRGAFSRKGAYWASALGLCGVASAVACVQAPRMCISQPDCGMEASCVAGRCLRRGAVAAVVTARRWLYAPVDVALVASGTGPNASSTQPSGLAALGRGDGALVLFRFAIDLPPEAKVLEAYLLLREAGDVDADPEPIALHAVRVAQRWEGRSVTWAQKPQIVEVGAPVTRVFPFTGRTVRLDVHDIVQRWRRRPNEDFGIAVIAEGRSTTGITFALEPVPAVVGRGDPVLASLEPRFAGSERGAHVLDVVVGPELELYVK
jgi:hypothetical protein